LFDENDFKNIEATIYWKRTDEWLPDKKNKKSPDQMTFYGRGGVHASGDTYPNACLATCYKGSLDYSNGKSYFEKEYHHLYASDGYGGRLHEGKSQFSIGDDESLKDSWLGLKFLIYDTNTKLDHQVEGKDIYQVRYEIWVDTKAKETMEDPENNTPQWKCMNIMIDKEDSCPSRCSDEARKAKDHGDDSKIKEELNKFKTGCSTINFNQIFSWGGPLVSFRIDWTNAVVKYASIREIEKPKKDPPIPEWIGVGCDHK
jgi:hypothetical protein